MTNRVKIDISFATMLKIIIAIFAIWFLFAIREIVVLFFIVLVIVSATAPLVDKMSRFMPRILALIILSLILITLLVAIGFLLIPPVINQIAQIATDLPYYIDKINPAYYQIKTIVAHYQDSLLNFSNQLGSFTSGIYTTTVSFFGGIVAIVTILVLSFYLLLEQNSIKSSLKQLIPDEHQERLLSVINKISVKMGNWLRGQGILMLTIGLLEGIVLGILNIPFALTLAVWGGLTEVIPYIGPWLGLIPAFIVAYTISPLMAIIVLIAFILIQQLEGQILVPKIMGKAVGLSPVIIILSLLIGAKLMGILGVIIAVPVAAAISVIISEWSEIKKIYS